MMISDIIKRMEATFVATAIGVVGSGAIVGVDVQVGIHQVHEGGHSCAVVFIVLACAH